MTIYVYKSTTGFPVNIDSYTITPNPGLQSKYPIDELDAYIGISLNRSDDGVVKTTDDSIPAMLARDPLTGGVTGLVGPDGVTLNFGLKDALLSAYMEGNAIPWSKAPIFTPSATYYQGSVVRGLAVNDQKNCYLACTTGTAGVSGPSGIGTNGVVDGTTSWLYLGKSTGDATSPLYSTVTPASASDVLDGYLAIYNISANATLGLTQTRNNLFASPVARVEGGVVIDSGTYADVQGSNGGTLAAPSYPVSNRRWSVHFTTNCRKWLSIQPNVMYPARMLIVVDGRPLTEFQFAHNITLSGGALLLNMDMFGPGIHSIDIYSTGAVIAGFYRIHCAPDEFVAPAPRISEVKMAFEGDSITQTGGTGSSLVAGFVEQLTARKLGLQRYFNNAIGGTGVISDNGGAKTTYGQRLPDVVSFAPDILVIGGNHNDADKGGSESARRAAVLAYLQAVRSALPSCLIVLTGSQMLQNESTVTGANSMWDMEVTAKAAFDQWADSNSLFIPLLTRTNDKFPTSASTVAQGWFYQASGAAPFNDAHPTPRYYDSISEIIANDIRRHLIA